jgi:hypothetical protein
MVHAGTVTRPIGAPKRCAPRHVHACERAEGLIAVWLSGARAGAIIQRNQWTQRCRADDPADYYQLSGSQQMPWTAGHGLLSGGLMVVAARPDPDRGRCLASCLTGANQVWLNRTGWSGWLRTACWMDCVGRGRRSLLIFGAGCCRFEPCPPSDKRPGTEQLMVQACGRVPMRRLWCSWG